MEMEMEFEKKIEMIPAYDKRSNDPSKNFGIHGVVMVFTLKGPLGAVCFQLSTNWQLPHVRKQEHQDTLRQAQHGVTDEYADPLHRRLSLCSLHVKYDPMPVSRSYHAYAPRYEGQEQRVNCDFLDGKPCYSSESYTNAQPIFEALVSEGLQGVWRELEYYYNNALETPIEERAPESLEFKETLAMALDIIAKAVTKNEPKEE